MKSKLPEGWDGVKLGEIIDLTMGQSPKSKYYNETGEGMPFMQGNTTFGRKYPEIERYTTKVTRVANKGDILMSVRAPVGALNISDVEELCIGRGLCSIRMKNGMQNFIYFAMEYNMKVLKSRESGTVFSSVNKGDLENLPMKLPPLPEQKAIADTLSALDDKIETNNKINENLEAQAQALFKHWFVDFEFPNEDGEPYQSSGGEMVESELGMIPPVFEVGSLGKSELGNLMTSGVDSYEGEKIYLATADVSGRDIVNHETMVTMDNKPSRANMQPEENTVWFAKMKDSRKLILVDQEDRILQDNYIFSTGFAGIKATDLSIYYLWTYLQSDEFDAIKNLYTTGTTMQAINNKNIRRIQIAIPTDEVLEKFNDIVQPMYKKIIENRNENIILAELRDTLLPKLMSGELRVPLD